MVPSESVDFDASKVTARGTRPLLGLTRSVTLGGLLATGWMLVVELVDDVPSLSVTARLAVNLPTVSYVWVTMGVELTSVLPSPKSKAYETMTPSRSNDLEPSKVTASGTFPVVALAARSATGALGGTSATPLGAGPPSIVRMTASVVASTIESVSAVVLVTTARGPVAVCHMATPKGFGSGSAAVASGTGTVVSAVRSATRAASGVPASAITAVLPSLAIATLMGEAPMGNRVTVVGPGIVRRPVRPMTGRLPLLWRVTSALLPSGVTGTPKARFLSFVVTVRGEGGT